MNGYGLSLIDSKFDTGRGQDYVAIDIYPSGSENCNSLDVEGGMSSGFFNGAYTCDAVSGGLAVSSAMSVLASTLASNEYAAYCLALGGITGAAGIVRSTGIFERIKEIDSIDLSSLRSCYSNITTANLIDGIRGLHIFSNGEDNALEESPEASRKLKVEIKESRLTTSFIKDIQKETEKFENVLKTAEEKLDNIFLKSNESKDLFNLNKQEEFDAFAMKLLQVLEPLINTTVDYIKYFKSNSEEEFLIKVCKSSIVVKDLLEYEFLINIFDKLKLVRNHASIKALEEKTKKQNGLEDGTELLFSWNENFNKIEQEISRLFNFLEEKVFYKEDEIVVVEESKEKKHN